MQKRKPEDELILQATNALQAVSSMPSGRSPKKKVQDEFDVFGQHVANELRHIKDFRARQLVKVKIQNALFEAQFSQPVAQPTPYSIVPQPAFAPQTQPRTPSPQVPEYNSNTSFSIPDRQACSTPILPAYIHRTEPYI